MIVFFDSKQQIKIKQCSRPINGQYFLSLYKSDVWEKQLVNFSTVYKPFKRMGVIILVFKYLGWNNIFKPI